MNRKVAIPLLTVGLVFSGLHQSAADPIRMTGAEFAASFRNMRGQPVVVIDCFVAGTAADFIRCETPNGAVSYMLEAETMLSTDLRKLFDTCPTGSAKRSECHFAVSGIVRRGREPSIDHARLLRNNE